MMTVETLVLGVDKRFPESRINVFIAHRCTVLAEELTNLFAISTVNHRSFCWAFILDRRYGWRLSEKP